MQGSFWKGFGVILGAFEGRFLAFGSQCWADDIFDVILTWFGSPLGPQVGIKLGPSLLQNRHPSCIIFSCRLRSDFEASWARFWKGFGVQHGVQKRT